MIFQAPPWYPIDHDEARHQHVCGALQTARQEKYESTRRECENDSRLHMRSTPPIRGGSICSIMTVVFAVEIDKISKIRYR